MPITTTDFVTFCDRTIDGLMVAVNRLDHDQLNQRPTASGIAITDSSAYQLTTHALAACDYWCSHVVAGEPTDRKRDSEFVAAGTAADLHHQAEALRDTLRRLAPELDQARRLAHPATTQTPLRGEWTTGAALLHAYEELAQHLGHVEMIVDVVLVDSR